MCGIFGIHISDATQVSTQELHRQMALLFTLSESRGKEAAGIAIRTPAGLHLLKSAVSAHAFVRTQAYRTLVQQCHKEALASGGYISLAGHARLVTHGLQDDNDNNQPVRAGQTVGVHNGIIINTDALWQKETSAQRQFEIDSEVIFRLIDDRSASGLAAASARTLKMLEGTASIATFQSCSDQLVLATNTGSLYWQQNSAGTFFFASERYIAETYLRKTHTQAWAGNSDDIQVLQPGTILRKDLPTTTVAITTPDNTTTEHNPVQSVPITEHAPVTAGKPRQMGVTLSHALHFKPPADIAEHARARIEQTQHLRRCTRCVLPETMPFIQFDAQGVCSYCHNHKPIQVQGAQALQEIADQHRSADGSPDCLVAISGGRDSTYGLHYIKTELKLNPIAYTYDWGMVTDLARRNQALVCGKLGVEQIIVSADIARKRNNIARNVSAWLRKPDLGMIPLFMAGDKQFYYYANVIQKQTRVPLIFFSAGNELERTDFKTGFCGIQTGDTGGTLRAIGLRNKLKIASYYLRNFVQNPGYINRSLFDTAHAFFSSYFMKHDYHYLYHYLHWDEAQIMDVLNQEYNWQSAEDTKASWRIGDGTAAFYNYIYLTVAGLTENDTFRSNQIREGVITRDQAIQLVRDENQARYQTIKEYLDLIGLDFNETLRAINRIPATWE